MNKILAIAQKEWKAYFKSPIAYIILILAIIIFNFFFFMIIDQNREASLRDVFQVMEFMFIFFMPLLTMKMFSEEKSTGTMEFLMTAPITNTAIVLGKYLGILLFFTLIITLTSVYYGIIEYFGQPDRWVILTGYVGIWLEGAFFLAIGMLMSSWTRHQMVSAMTSYAILFLLYFSITIMKYVTGPLETLIQKIGTWSHLENFSSGLITINAIIYYFMGILICLLLTRLSIENRWSPRKKTGSIALGVLLSVALCAGAHYGAYRFPWRWDVTKAKQHTLSANTIEFVQGLKQNVQITALYAGLPPKYLEDLFKEYKRVSNNKIQTNIIDPIENIGYAAQFGNVINGDEKKVIVISGNVRRDIDFTENPLSEEQLTNALIRVSRKKRNIYFLTGHGEYSITDEQDKGLSRLVKLLASNNISSTSLMLGTTPKIPEDCDVLVIAGPKNELTDKERKTIEDYLKKGGDALFLIEHVLVTTPDKPLTKEEEAKNPSFNNILNNWGVTIGTDIVVDLNNHAGGDVGSPATRNYVKHPAITEGLDYTFYVRPRSITALSKRRPTIKTAPIVLSESKENSWGETNRTLEIRFDEAMDKAGPVPLAFVIWEAKEDEDISDTRIITFTDADFLSNVFIDQYSNAAMGLHIINWLAELDYQVFLDPNTINVEKLDLSSKQKRLTALILLLMPILIALSGIIVLSRKRQRKC